MMTDQEVNAEIITMFSIVVVVIIVGFSLFLLWRKLDAKKRLTKGQVEWLRVQEYGETPKSDPKSND
jgi:hypothetical protein